jgi:hypothetical protein
MRLSVKPTSRKIVDMGDVFLGTFFNLIKDEPFLDCLLGLQYATRNIINFAEKTNIYTKEELEKIILEINLASDQTVECNFKKINLLIEALKQSNWEEIDDTSE